MPTHTGKAPGGCSGPYSTIDLILLDQKRRKSAEQQGFDALQAVGKDEVPGPNPGSSSMKKFLKSLVLSGFRNFFMSNLLFDNVQQHHLGTNWEQILRGRAVSGADHGFTSLSHRQKELQDLGVFPQHRQRSFFIRRCLRRRISSEISW